MALWTYRCYDDGDGPPNLWQRWYDAHPEVQGKHDAKFRILETMPVWNNEHLTDNLPGDVVEVRLVGNPQWRVFGHYGSVRREFVITAIGWHKGKQYKPNGVIITAALRKIELEEGKASAPVCERPS